MPLKIKTNLLGTIAALLLFSCGSTNTDMDKSKNKQPKKASDIRWDFKNLEGWKDATQSGAINYSIENEQLKIFTNANSWDRSKIKTLTTYTTGTYTWRIFVPEMGVGDMATIGAFLYNSNSHELDFEIGYGKQTIRKALNAAPDELVVHMSSQDNPSQSHKAKIKRGQWHTFSMELSLNTHKNYQVNWKINDELAATSQLEYGNKKKFAILCSLENLTFIGDHIPSTRNYALFDYVSYQVK
ncbi:hypothetical protein [Flavobacterium muglaense]|nr:hypothetical protein [Flavobacterium muglaense]